MARRARRAGCSDAAVGESRQGSIVTPTSRWAGIGVDQVHGGTPLPIGAHLGTFEVTGVIQQGRFGVVYVGADRSLLRKVAIKEYLPARLACRMADGNVGVRSLRHQQSFRDGMQLFLSEARMLAALDEPALAKVMRFWEQHGTAYMAMPLYEGRTLKDVLRDWPKPSEAWLKAMLGPLLDALATLHRSDCYPCDVTPDNIVVLNDGVPLLFDFGTGRSIVASTTEDVTDVVNPGFAPIEKYAHDPPMPEGPWTDIYAIATVIYLAITGEPPPAPTTRIVSDTMPPLGDVT
jgi:serine/threonine protein kinase